LRRILGLSTGSILLSLSIIKIIYIILGVEFCEDAVDVLGGLPAQVCDVEADQFWGNVVVGRHYHLDVLLFVMLTQLEDLLWREQLVEGQEIEGIERRHLIHGTDNIDRDRMCLGCKGNHVGSRMSHEPSIGHDSMCTNNDLINSGH